MSDLSERLDPAVEAGWIARARQGDRAALESLLAAHQDRVFRTALGLLGGNEEAAREVAQEVLVSAFRNLHSFRGESRFATWLYRMTANFVKNHQVAQGRRKARFVSLDHSGDPDDPDGPAREYAAGGVSARDQAAGNEMMAVLMERMQLLPEEYRSVLVLRYIEDRSYEEIAEALGIALGTVKSRVNRARAELRRHMAEMLTEGGDLE